MGNVTTITLPKQLRKGIKALFYREFAPHIRAISFKKKIAKRKQKRVMNK